jgi:hypothetical protein
MLTNLKRSRLYGAALGALLVGASSSSLSQGQASPQSASMTASEEIAALKADNERLKSLVPSQSHAMMDVAYHFTNLWFAGQHSNWPLAQFYFNEARSHIRWAIRIVPVRHTAAGDLKLEEVFAGFDRSLLSGIQKEITAKDRKGFIAAYRAAIGGCNACHAAAEKPFLHVQVPDQQEVRIMDFDPPK